MKTLHICLAALSLAGSPLALAAQEDPGMFTRTMRGIGAFFGSEADVRVDGRFTNDESILIREAMADRARARAQRRGEYDGRYHDGEHHDYDDDDDEDQDGHKGSHKGKKGGHYSNYDGGGKKHKRLPPGLKKKLERGGELPPGWQRKVERGEVVSDDVWAQSRAVPRSVVDGIRQVPGTEVIQVGDRVVRVLSQTREIIDVIDLISGP